MRPVPTPFGRLHQAFVDAGADILLTNSFGGNRRCLALHGLEGRTRELNRLAAENARAVARGAGRRVVVAGSLGPTGDLLAPLGPLTEDEAVAVFVEQIEGLRDGGVDVVWIETMSSPEEIRAAARAAGRLGTPYTATASFDTAGKTMMGLAPAAFAELVGGFDPQPLAFGANCGVGAADLLVSILAMSEARPGRRPDRQGQRRPAAMAWRAYSLLRLAGTDGRLRRARGRRRRAHHRGMLRDQAGPSGGDAARPRRPSAGDTAERRQQSSRALGPLVAPAAAKPSARVRRRGQELK